MSEAVKIWMISAGEQGYLFEEFVGKKGGCYWIE
jgi:hypothetical protein